MRNIFLVGFFVLLSACSGTRVVGPPSAGTATAEAAILRPALDQALGRMRMRVVQQEQDGSLLVQWGDARRGFRFRIRFEAPGYTVTLVDSVNMHQRVDSRTGQMVISSRYHRYINKLHQLVARYLGANGRPTSAGGQSGSERVFAVHQRPAVAAVQRGLMVAGLQIEQADEAAGVVTTGYVDTGFGYGFIDGQGATIYVAYTASVYPDSVRVVQHAQKCAVLYSLGGQQLRCEALPGGAPGRVQARLDELLPVVQREVLATLPAAPAQPAQPAQTGQGVVQQAPVQQPAQPTAGCSGTIDETTAQTVVAQGAEGVRQCLAQGNRGVGTVTVTAIVDSNGGVTNVSLSGAAQPDTVLACIQGTVSRWRFPAPTGGACAELHAPFLLAE